MFIDMDFVRSLEYGMPPTSGMNWDRQIGDADDNSSSIQDVLLFPQMKPEKELRKTVQKCSKHWEYPLYG